MSSFSFNDLVNILERVEETKTTSLPQFTKAAILQSPMFIQNSLLEETIVNDIVKNLYSLYTGYILTALNMTSKVSDNRTVRDIITTVSTDTSMIPAMESIDYLDAESIGKGFSKNLRSPIASEDDDPTYLGSGSKDSIISEKTHKLPIASGRILEVEFNVGDGKTVKAPIHVRFNPRIVPTQVVDYMITAEFKQSLHQRWMKMQAGEIRFFKDFIMQLDILQKRTSALKHDKDNALSDLFRYQNKAGLRQLLKFAMGRNRTFNLANSVIILNEADVKRFTKRQGVNFNRVNDRRRFFAKTYALFIVLVDPNYSQVSIYTNGIDDVAQYTYNELKSSAGKDSFDLKEIMEAMSTNQMPTF